MICGDTLSIMTMSLRHKVLAVITDSRTRSELARAAQATFDLHVLPDCRQIAATIAAHPDAAALIVDSSSPAGGIAPIQLLQSVRSQRAPLRRVMIADAADLSAVVDGLHSGVIDAIVYRPIDLRQLHAAVLSSGGHVPQPNHAPNQVNPSSRLSQ